MKLPRHDEFAELSETRRALMQARAQLDSLRMQRRTDPKIVWSEIVMELHRRCVAWSESSDAYQQYVQSPERQTTVMLDLSKVNMEHWHKMQATIAEFVALVPFGERK